MNTGGSMRMYFGRRGTKETTALPSRGRMVTTFRTEVEGVHFDLAYTTPAEIAHRALASALNEAASMAATPSVVQVSLGLRQDTSEPFLMEFDGGLQSLARRFKVRIERGGDVPSPLALIVRTTLFSSVADDAWDAESAKKGDVLAVIGEIGGSAAGLACLKRMGRHELRTRQDILLPHLRPEPKLVEAALLGTAPSAVVDVRDGLVADLWTLSSQSGVGASIDLTRLPISEAAQRGATLVSGNIDGWALYGPEDYALLAAIPKEKWPAIEKKFRTAKRMITAIGEVRARKEGVRLKNREGEMIPLERRMYHPFVRRQSSRRNPIV